MYKSKCKYCGLDFTHKYKKRKYCSSKCGCSLSKRNVDFYKNCEICNKIIYTPPSVNKKVCSKKCKSLLYKKIIKNKGGPPNKIKEKNKIRKKCPICNKIFKVLPCYKKQILCSRKCQFKYRAILGAKASGPISKPQKIIFGVVKNKYNDAILSDTSLLKYKEIDILVPSIKLAIEVQGRVHYEPIFGEDTLKRIQKSDKAKRTMLKNKGYKLIEIVLIKNEKSDKLIKRIENILSKVKR